MAQDLTMDARLFQLMRLSKKLVLDLEVHKHPDSDNLIEVQIYKLILEIEKDCGQEVPKV